MHLHGRLLEALVAPYVEGGGSNARHLGHRGPWVAAGGDLLQQFLIERGLRFNTLHVHRWFSPHFDGFLHLANPQSAIDSSGKPGCNHDAGLLQCLKSIRCRGQIIRARWKQIEQITSIGLNVHAAIGHQRWARHRHRRRRQR